MTTTLKSIGRRIASVKSTQKITRAMKLVAAARLRRTQEASLSARPYAEEIERLAYRVSAQAGVDAPPLMRRRMINSLDLIVISSDRGLCGGFNENLINRVSAAVRTHERHGVKIQLFVYGRKGIAACRRRRLAVASAEALGHAPVTAERIGGVVETLADRFLKGFSDGSFVVYNYFRTAATQEVVVKDLLPLHQRRRDRSYRVDYVFEPSRTPLMDELIEQTLMALLVQAFRESHLAELAARMTAMDAATKNGDDMTEHLTALYHRTRQRVITRELMDIVNGAEALQHQW